MRRLLWIFGALLITAAPMLLLVRLEVTGCCAFTGEAACLRETFLHLPGGHRIPLRRSLAISAASPFGLDFGHLVSRGPIAWGEPALWTGNPWFLALPERQRQPASEISRPLGWFVQFYNRDPAFRDHIRRQIASGQLDERWFVEDLCTPERWVCGAPAVDITSANMQAVMAYVPAQR